MLEAVDERDHLAAIASLRPILAPSSIAIAGVSDAPGDLGRAVLANISRGEFGGVVTPVCRAGGVGCSKPAIRSLDQMEAAPELVIIAAAGDELLEFAAEAAESGARALLVPPGVLSRTATRSACRRSNCWRSSEARACGWLGRTPRGFVTRPPRSA